jgi:hypothetical protein
MSLPRRLAPPPWPPSHLEHPRRRLDGGDPAAAWPATGTTTVPSCRRHQVPSRYPAARARAEPCPSPSGPEQVHLPQPHSRRASIARRPATFVVADARSPAGSRDTSSPHLRPATHRRHRSQAGPPHTEGAPPPPSSPGLCLAGPLVAAGR